MFGETTISYVKIWNHPIETTSCKQMFQVPGRNTVHNSFKKKTLSCFPPEGVRTRNCQLRFTSKPGWFEPPSPCCNPLLVPFRIGKMDMDVSQNRGKTTQNGWFISWKTLLKWMIWRFSHIFGNTHIQAAKMTAHHDHHSPANRLFFSFATRYVSAKVASGSWDV